MKPTFFFEKWRELRELRKALVGVMPEYRCMGVSETARILKAYPGCGADGDILHDFGTSRYFNLQIGIIEKVGVTIAAPNPHLLLQKKPQP